MQEQTRPPRWLWRWTIGTLALWWLSGLIASGIAQLSGFLLVMLVAFLLASALEPSVDFIQARGMRRGFAAAVVLLGALVLGSALAATGGTVAWAQVQAIRDSLPEILASASPLLTRLGITLDLTSLGSSLSDATVELLQENLGPLLLQSGLLLGKLALGIFLLFYLLADGPRLRRTVCSLLPPAQQEVVLSIWTAAIDKTGGYFIIRGLLASFSSLAHWLFFLAIDLPYALALGIWVGVISQVIPALGTYLAAVLPLLVAVSISGPYAVGVLIFLVLYQQVENYLLAPRLARRVMEVHPAVALLSAIGGAVLAGAAGALIAVPLVATVQAVLAATLERHQLIEDPLFKQQEKRPRRGKGSKRVDGK